MQVLADFFGIPCRLVKGPQFTGSDDVAMNFVRIDDGRYVLFNNIIAVFSCCFHLNSWSIIISSSICRIIIFSNTHEQNAILDFCYNFYTLHIK